MIIIGREGRVLLTEQLFLISAFIHEVILWFLIALSVISLALIMERFFSLRSERLESSLILSEMMSALESGRNAHMKLVYDKYSLLNMGMLLQKSWDYIIQKGPVGLEEMMNSQILSYKIKSEGRLSFLASLGSNAPFIGLLGTIFGVMESFTALGSPNGSVDVVMVGISKALVATAVGLIVAIPAITSYNYFQKQWKIILYQLESMKESAISFAKTCKRS